MLSLVLDKNKTNQNIYAPTCFVWNSTERRSAFRWLMCGVVIYNPHSFITSKIVILFLPYR